MPTPTSSSQCLRYWDLADHIRIDDAESHRPDGTPAGQLVGEIQD